MEKRMANQQTTIRQAVVILILALAYRVRWSRPQQEKQTRRVVSVSDADRYLRHTVDMG
jgi:hypothetical protein